MAEPRQQPEPHYVDAQGEKGDAILHAAMLDDNDAADRAFAEDAIRLSIEAGVDEKDARRFYGGK